MKACVRTKEFCAAFVHQMDITRTSAFKDVFAIRVWL